MLTWTIGGFADEFYRRLGRHYGMERPAYEFESGVAEKAYLEMLKEAGVEIRFGAALAAVRMEGARIAAITLKDGSELSAKVFVDAGYEGDLMARAGVAHAVGRESKAEFGEDLAGIRFDPEVREAPTVDKSGNLLPGISGWKKDFKEGDAHPGVMNYNFRLIVTRDPAVRVPFPEPKRYDPARYQLLANWLKAQEGKDVMKEYGRFIDLYPRRNGKFEMNNRQAAIFSLGHIGGQLGWPEADEVERRRIYDDHLEYTLGLLHFLTTEEVVPENIRNDMRQLGLHSGEFADNGQPHSRPLLDWLCRFLFPSDGLRWMRRVDRGSKPICHRVRRWSFESGLRTLPSPWCRAPPNPKWLPGGHVGARHGR